MGSSAARGTFRGATPPVPPLYLYLYVCIVGRHCKRVDEVITTVHYLRNMITYTKLFHSILDSTIWQESKEARLVWITMLAMVDRDGVVRASVPGLADRAKVEIEACKAALRRFKSPDEYSRSKEFEGRRIEDVDGGWLLLNHGKYREQLSAADRAEYQRVKQMEYRRRKKTVRNEAGCAGARQAIKEGLEDAKAAPKTEAERLAELAQMGKDLKAAPSPSAPE